MSELAVVGCTVEITSGQTASAKIITTPPSTKVFADQKAVYFGDIDVQLTTLSQGNYVNPLATITIKATASKNLDSNGNKAVQKNDSGSQVVTLTDPDSGATITPTVTIKISDAGQQKALAL